MLLFRIPCILKEWETHNLFLIFENRKLLLNRIVLILFFNSCFCFTNAQFTSHHLTLKNKEHSLKKKSFVIPLCLIASGTVLSNSQIITDVQHNFVGNKKTTIDNYLQLAPAGIIIGLETLGIKGKHKPLQTAMIFTMSNVILNSIVHPLKSITKVQRPDNSDNKSFPSGHTTEAFASAELMRIEFKDNNTLLGYAGYLMAGATGYLRMYNNKHWISDVLAGAGIGIASTKLSVFIFDEMAARFKQKNQKNQHSIFLPSYQNKQICMYWIKRF